MVSKEDAKRFLLKIIPFADQIPDISERVLELIDNKEFREELGKLGTIGSLFIIGLKIFDKSLENISDTEKTYYSLINRTAISVAEKIIMESDYITIDEQNNENILKQMINIYSFKDTEQEEYKKWNGLAVDHPIVKHFRENIFKLLEDNNLLASRYSNFATEFNSKFKEEVKDNPTFLKYQKLKTQKLAYLQWLLKNIDKPNPIDGGKKVTDYYVQNRAIEFDLGQQQQEEENVLYQTNEYWNISDAEAENYFIPQKKWTIDDFLNSEQNEDSVKYIAAPFGTGKTTFAKIIVMRIVNDYLSGQDTWVPIYVPLKQKLASFYREGADIYHDLRDIIKPEDEKILLVCDGLDEYPEPDDVLSLKNDLLNIPSNYSISDLKIIFTTRLEAGFPKKLGIKRYVRLLPFTPKQVTEFFKRYGHENLTFEDIEKYGLQEQKEYSFYKIDLLKPLFCWMFALSHLNLEVAENMDIGVARLILYSKFIHSILEGRYQQYSQEIVNEKWIMRKIAALKAISKEIYEEDLREHLQKFIEKDQEKDIDLQNINLHIILTSYFKLNEKRKNRQSVDFLHKSFQEYLLAEYYVESILYNKGFRLNIGRPSDVTVEFLSSFLSIIKDAHKKEYEKHLLRIVKSLYPNKADKQDEEIIPLLVEFKETLLDNAVKIFEENKIAYIDVENKTLESEFWKKKDIANYKKYYENFIYKAISLFVIKILDEQRNPESLFEYIKDSENVLSNLKYFPFANLYKADLHDANLRAVDLRKADLRTANLHDANLRGANLYGADLYYADLNGADLRAANLRGANLYGADLTDADLNGADLNGADLNGANLRAADLYGADLRVANLRAADLYGADHNDAFLYAANLRAADLRKANLYGADLTNASLNGANLSSADLRNADLNGADLCKVHFRGVNIKGAKLQEAIVLNPSDFRNLIVNDYTTFYGAITDDKYFFKELDLIKLKNMPKLVEKKENLIEELKNKSYNEYQIERFVSQSKFL